MPKSKSTSKCRECWAQRCPRLTDPSDPRSFRPFESPQSTRCLTPEGRPDGSQDVPGTVRGHLNQGIPTAVSRETRITSWWWSIDVDHDLPLVHCPLISWTIPGYVMIIVANPCFLPYDDDMIRLILAWNMTFLELAVLLPTVPTCGYTGIPVNSEQVPCGDSAQPSRGQWDKSLQLQPWSAAFSRYTFDALAGPPPQVLSDSVKTS